MHIGKFLKNVMESQRYSVADMAKLVNKTETAVRKDFEKSTLHMSVLEAFGKALDFNPYDVLAKNWEGDLVQEPEEIYNFKPRSKQTQKQESGESISITFQVDPAKKEKLIKLISS